MKGKTTLIIIALVVAIISHTQAQKAPTIPSAFSTTWSFYVSFFEGAEVIAGTLVVNYPKNQTYAEIQDPGTTPYQFQTTIIGHPINQSFIQGYAFLNVGRCWTIREPLDSTLFHYFPLHIPDDARFIKNNSASGTGLWSWKYDIIELLQTVEVTMEIRWRDGGVLAFVIGGSDYPPFQLTWRASTFDVFTPPKTVFDKPAGPCPYPPLSEYNSAASSPLHEQLLTAMLSSPNTGSYGSVENTVPFKLAQHFMSQHIKSSHASLLAPKRRVLSLIQSALQTNPKSKTPPAAIQAPTPPTIKPYFSADYTFGYGFLNKTNNYQGVSIQRGFVSIDSTTLGAYLNIREDASQNVPWEFNANFISNPIKGSERSNGYVYLSYGRCWYFGEVLTIGLIPFYIPADAQLMGTDLVDGKMANLWGFVGEVVGFYGNVTIATAVDKGDSRGVDVIFAQVVYDAESTWLKLAHFDDSKPYPVTYDAPQGPCTPANPNLL